MGKPIAVKHHIPRQRPQPAAARRAVPRWWALRYLLGIVLLWLAAPVSASEPEVWVRIDTAESTLAVMRGGRVVAGFDDIAVGRGGVSRERRRGDQRTPLGEFRIIKIKDESNFHRFFMFDYPDEPRAQLALQRGEIDQPTFRSIRGALRAGRVPPQNTSLGGYLGIHGLGGGDRRIHEQFNWTEGCVALTNEQVDRLAELVRAGTRVVID